MKPAGRHVFAHRRRKASLLPERPYTGRTEIKAKDTYENKHGFSKRIRYVLAVSDGSLEAFL